MNEIIFTLGDWPVTVATALLAGGGLALVLLVALLVAVLRGNSRKAEEAAQTAMDGLRANFNQQIAERDTRIRELETQLNQQREVNTGLQAEAAGLRAQMEEHKRQAEENLARFQKARQQMTDEFKVIAQDVLKSHGETFSKQNREQVDTLLKPLREKITEFHTGLMKDRAAMGEQIRALLESNQTITAEANNLARALKGSSQTQGAWGEMILSTILERSGLREGEQYFTQQNHAADDGGRVRTDVEILMPNGDRLVVDSKVSLTAFEAYTNAEDEGEQAVQLQAHVTSIRNHIKTLGEKEYQRHADSGLDYVMMFVPIEAALAAAISHDSRLFEYGMSQGVMLTTPTTLMTVLRTVRNVWDIEKRHQNAEEIADRAGSLYDKVSGFLATMDKLGQNIDRAQQSYADAKGQLSTGRGNVLRQVEMLRELGAKTSKQIPAGWQAGEEDGPARLSVEGGDGENEGGKEE